MGLPGALHAWFVEQTYQESISKDSWCNHHFLGRSVRAVCFGVLWSPTERETQGISRARLWVSRQKEHRACTPAGALAAGRPPGLLQDPWGLLLPSYRLRLTKAAKALIVFAKSKAWLIIKVTISAVRNEIPHEQTPVDSHESSQQL